MAEGADFRARSREFVAKVKMRAVNQTINFGEKHCVDSIHIEATESAGSVLAGVE